MGPEEGSSRSMSGRSSKPAGRSKASTTTVRLPAPLYVLPCSACRFGRKKLTVFTWNSEFGRRDDAGDPVEVGDAAAVRQGCLSGRGSTKVGRDSLDA